MINKVEELIFKKITKSGKTFETNRLLESFELSMGGEAFEFVGGYIGFAASIEELCHIGKLVPVKNSGTNGMNPKLYSKYRILDEQNLIKVEEYKDELLALHPMIKKDHYLKDIKGYELDREHILRLNGCLQAQAIKNWKKYRCTLNERSFEIFNDEKFLDKQGKVFFKKMGIDIKVLNCYRTYEAFFYIFLKPEAEGNALIIENKDTFMSLVNSLNSINRDRFNKNNINLLIYGEGNKITKSFEFIYELYSGNTVGTVFYYGDIDYPGVDIYQRLVKKFPELNIVPHTALYRKLVESVDQPPKARNNSKVTIDVFWKYFSEEMAGKISNILNEGRYIPQEGFSFAKGDFEI